MARRRRRRERRDTTEHRPATPEKRDKRAEESRQRAFDASQLSLRRRRTFIGALGFIPLLGSFGCGTGLQVFCSIPQEWWLAIWAALFGSFLGITIRLFLARRRFLRGDAGA